MDLPHIQTTLTPDEAVDRVATMSKRGKLPGFSREGDALFSSLAYGWSFLDQRLICEATRDADTTTMRFRTVLPPKMPLIVGVIFAITIWPGVWFTDQMLATYWNWYLGLLNDMPWLTYAWYLPLTILPLPWMFKSMMNRSHTAAHESAKELIERINAVIDGRLIDGHSNAMVQQVEISQPL
ncbi:MAG: hypothetical protein ACF8LL_04365 [Phycisphaerales bacterium]